MTPFIKICGIKKDEHVRSCRGKHGALWYGLVFTKNHQGI